MEADTVDSMVVTASQPNASVLITRGVAAGRLERTVGHAWLRQKGRGPVWFVPLSAVQYAMKKLYLTSVTSSSTLASCRCSWLRHTTLPDDKSRTEE